MRPDRYDEAVAYDNGAALNDGAAGVDNARACDGVSVYGAALRWYARCGVRDEGDENDYDCLDSQAMIMHRSFMLPLRRLLSL